MMGHHRSIRQLGVCPNLAHPREGHWPMLRWSSLGCALPYHGLDWDRVHNRLTHVLVEFCWVACCRFLWAPSVCSVLRCPASSQAEQRIAKFSVVLTHGSECHSQHFDPLLRGRTERFGVAGKSDPIGVGLSQMKMFLGCIVTVMDGGGRSPTMSNRGVTNHQSTLVHQSISGGGGGGTQYFHTL